MTKLISLVAIASFSVACGSAVQTAPATPVVVAETAIDADAHCDEVEFAFSDSEPTVEEQVAPKQALRSNSVPKDRLSATYDVKQYVVGE